MRCQVFSFPLRLTLSIAAAWQQCLAFFGTPLVLEPSLYHLSGDAGLPPAEGYDCGGPPALRCDAASFRRMVKTKQESERS
jgi:hypothetical protein